MIKTRLSRPFLAGLALLFTLSFVGCGYHTAGHTTTIPEYVKTIAIPAFVNETQTYKIEQRLTASVVREMITRTHYHVVNETSDDADATLRGTVLATYTTPLTYDSQTGKVSTSLLQIGMRVSLINRSGKVLWENPSYLYRSQYELSQDAASFFEEESPALQRIAQDFARNLVSNIVEAY